MSENYGRTKLACYVGYVVQAIINNFLPILFIIFKEEYNLDYEKLGRIILINFSVQIVADLASPFLAKKIGYKGSVILCHILAASGLSLLSFLPNIISNTYTAIIIPVIIYAFGSGIIEAIVSPLMNLLPTGKKAANMAFLHSFYCWGQAFTVIVTTVMISLFGTQKWQLIPLIWASVPAFNCLFFIFVPVVEPNNKKEESSEKSFYLTRDFWCFVIFMLCAGSSEISMAEWASMFAQKGLGISKVTGDLLGPCMFAVFMGAGRIIFGIFSGKFSPRKIVICLDILCIACYLTVGICNIPAISVIACALCGFSVSYFWPGTYSIAAARFKNAGTLMFSIYALCGDIGCSAGPWLFGIIADAFGLKSGFLLSSVFPGVMLFAALFLLKEKDCKF